MTERISAGKGEKRKKGETGKKGCEETKKIESKGGDEIESELLFISIPTVSDV